MTLDNGKIQNAYKGVPVWMTPNNILELDEVLPHVGAISTDTCLFEYRGNNDNSGEVYVDYDKERFFPKLYKLAAAREATMVKNAQALYENIRKTCYFSYMPKNPKKLTEKEKGFMVRALLSGAEVNWTRDVREHALAVATAAEIPLEQVAIQDNEARSPHELLAFKSNGKPLTITEQKLFTRQCQWLEDWVGNEIYDMLFPGPEDGQIECWNVTLPASVPLSKKTADYEILDEFRGRVDKLLDKKTGRYTVILPYAQPHSREYNQVEFSPRKTVKIKVGSKIAAERLQEYWSEFGDMKNSKIISARGKEQ